MLEALGTKFASFVGHPELGSGSHRIGPFETLKQVQGDKKD